MSFSKNIEFLLEKSHLSAEKLADKLGVKRQSVYDWIGGTTPRKETIDKIATVFNVKVSDLFREDLTEINSNKGTSAQEPLTLYGNASPEDRKVMDVRMVEIRAQAGYLRGFNDPEYLETLPTITVNEKFERGGYYMCFRIEGDSMDDGSKYSWLHADVVLARELSTNHWSTKLNFDKTWIIIHKTEGIICKKIVKHDKENGIITCHSLNNLYDDFTLILKDVNQLFYIKQLVERQF